MPNNGNNELFSLFQFFVDGSQEKVLELVPVEDAVLGAKNVITSMGGRLGTTQRVIIVDWGDCIVFEWIYGKGIVFPKLEDSNGTTGTQEDQASP